MAEGDMELICSARLVFVGFGRSTIGVRTRQRFRKLRFEFWSTSGIGSGLARLIVKNIEKGWFSRLREHNFLRRFTLIVSGPVHVCLSPKESLAAPTDRARLHWADTLCLHPTVLSAKILS
jgi:hypothetical protein